MAKKKKKASQAATHRCVLAKKEQLGFLLKKAFSLREKNLGDCVLLQEN